MIRGGCTESAMTSSTLGLHRLIYLSAAVGVLRADELDRILLRSKASNSGAGITGLLLFHEGSFLQMIEGPAAGVMSLPSSLERYREAWRERLPAQLRRSIAR